LDCSWLADAPNKSIQQNPFGTKTDNRVTLARLKTELHGQLNDAWAGAHTQDATEVAWAEDAPGYCVDATAGGKNSADIADGIVAVWVIEQVEEIRTKLEARRFTNGPAL
jgi:hypothetical protein